MNWCIYEELMSPTKTVSVPAQRIMKKQSAKTN